MIAMTPLQHLVSIDQLDPSQASHLMQRAIQLKQSKPHHYPCLTMAKAAMLFYENSTRTSMSFRIAAQHCQLPLFSLSMQHSSEKKGETFLDTLRTLEAMGVSLLIIRHPQSHILFKIMSQLPPSLHLINAGDGQNEHPTQALLDMMTILEQFPEPQSLKIAVVGDIKHSRVAHSFQKLCALLGINHLRLIAPKVWQPDQLLTGHITDNLEAGIEGADVIMALRVQQERLNPDEHYPLDQYYQTYGLTQQTLSRTSPKAIILHPGPLNRHVEISDSVADGLQSFILKQVNNGVFLRMAVFEAMYAS